MLPLHTKNPNFPQAQGYRCWRRGVVGKHDLKNRHDSETRHLIKNRGSKSITSLCVSPGKTEGTSENHWLGATEN